ncbi:MAG: Gfo/Idh/MocA family oxidoreductase [Armatimonadota bacterium]|nr:Gfo/Idh/MocA family oxidoreductase [Armatimonadota bacterium]
MTTPIRWGVIGCGDVVEHKSGPALQQAAGSELVVVMRRDGAKAADFARRHGIARWYDDADKLLADPDVNAVYIATPPDSHAELTLRAAWAGKRVLVEKPMARTVTECETMIAGCRAAVVPLHVAYYRRFYPRFQRAKQLIDEGLLGRLVSVTLQMAKPTPARLSEEIPWRLRPEVSGGGLFVDTGSHRLDMIHFLAGDMIDVHGFASHLGYRALAEDSVALTFRIAHSKALGTVACHFEVSPLRRDRLEIVGTDGVLLFDSFDDDFFTLQRRDGMVETFTRPNPEPQHLPFVEALIRVYNGDPMAHVTGEEGLKTNRVLAQILGTF